MGVGAGLGPWKPDVQLPIPEKTEATVYMAPYTVYRPKMEFHRKGMHGAAAPAAVAVVVTANACDIKSLLIVVNMQQQQQQAHLAVNQQPPDADNAFGCCSCRFLCAPHGLDPTGSFCKGVSAKHLPADLL